MYVSNFDLKFLGVILIWAVNVHDLFQIFFAMFKFGFRPHVTSLPLEKWSPSPLGSIKASLFVSDCWRHWQVHVRGTENKFRPRVGACCLPQTLNSVFMKSSMHEEKWFLVSNMEISKTLPRPSYILEWLRRRYRCLIFHIHDLNLFKPCSNLGFDQDSNGHKILKNKKIKKQGT